VNLNARNIGRLARTISLAGVIFLAVYALLPPEEEVESAQIKEGTNGEVSQGVEYVIRFSPGPTYIPGYVPYGIGEPLQGVAKIIKEFERVFPDTRVEVLVTPITSREYLVTQLSSGQAPDILNVNVEDVWVDTQKEWYVPLDTFLESPNEFIREQGNPDAPGYHAWWDMFKYQAISRGKAAPDNKNYCISYDMVETGVYYNKDIFRKVGVEVPSTWDEFMVVLKKIAETPITIADDPLPRTVIPMMVNIDVMTDWCNDLFFDQLYCSLLPGIDLLQDPVREAYLQGYLDDVELYFLFKKGFFTRNDKRFSQLYRLIYEFRQYCNKNISGTVQIEREFVTQRAAMLWIPCMFTYRLKADRALGFDWDIFYLPQFTKKTSRYASDTPMCVIGGSAAQFEVTNSAVSDTPEDMPFQKRIATSKRLRRVIQFLQFLCVPEKYKQIVNEYECYLPNIVGVEVLPALKPFEAILARQYTTTKWAFTFDLKFFEVFRRMLELYLNDGIDHEEFMAWQEENIRSAITNLAVRKPIDEEALQRAWDERAAARVSMEDLPDGAR
jgi:raffinose/stachyose/melibiose transport system substrate-binding protein